MPDSARSATGTRFLMLLAPDWPASAAGVEAGARPGTPIAVFHGSRVIHTNAPARAAGVSAGQVRRVAQLREPRLLVARRDEDRDARHFLPLLAACERVSSDFQILYPGLVAIPLSGPSRFYGSELEATKTILTSITDATGHELLAGIGDAIFTALVAARTGSRVPPAQDARFLAGHSVAELACPEYPAWNERTDLIAFLQRLGLRTLGDFAALPTADVATRFGADARLAHRQASGSGAAPYSPLQLETPLAETEHFDPPVERADALSFAGRAAAGRLLSAVAGRGLRCTQVQITVVAETGAASERVWRLASTDANEIADRVRWQVEGWLAETNAAQAEEHAGIARLELATAEVIAPLADQSSLLDSSRGGTEKVGRTLTRVQGLLGMDAVLSPALQGGRDPEEENLWTPWQQSAAAQRPTNDPWPGQLPAPHPVRTRHCSARLLDAHGAEVEVDVRNGLGSEPAWLCVPENAERQRVRGYSASWPVESYWWDAERAIREARVQVQCENGGAYLLSRSGGLWTVVASYD